MIPKFRPRRLRRACAPRIAWMIGIAVLTLAGSGTARAWTESPVLMARLRAMPEARAFDGVLGQLDAIRRAPAPVVTDSLEPSPEWSARCADERAVADAIEARIATCTSCSAQAKAVGWVMAVTVREDASRSCVSRSTIQRDREPRVTEWLQQLAREHFVDADMASAMTHASARCVESFAEVRALATLAVECSERGANYASRRRDARRRTIEAGPSFGGADCGLPNRRTWQTITLGRANATPNVTAAFLDVSSLEGLPADATERQLLIDAIAARFRLQGGPPLLVREATARLLAAVRAGRDTSGAQCGAPTSEAVMLARLGATERRVAISAYDYGGEVHLTTRWIGADDRLFVLEAYADGRSTTFSDVLALAGTLALPAPRPYQSMTFGANRDDARVHFPRHPDLSTFALASSDFGGDAVAEIFAPIRERMLACPHATGSEDWGLAVEYRADGRTGFVEAIRRSDGERDACVEASLATTTVAAATAGRRWLLGGASTGIGNAYLYGLTADDPWRSASRSSAFGPTFARAIRVRTIEGSTGDAYFDLADEARASLLIRSVVARCFARVHQHAHLQADVSVTLTVDELGRITTTDATSTGGTLDTCLEAELPALGLPCRFPGSAAEFTLRACAVGEYEFPSSYFPN